MKTFYNSLNCTLVLFLSVFAINAMAQTHGSVSGSISTSDGKPAEAVSIAIKELNKATISNEQGRFMFKNIKPGSYTIKTFAIGLVAQEKTLTITAGQTTTVNFTLAENAQKLDEVVVTGYKSANQKPVSASKMAIKPLDNPQMVQVVSSQVIADQQINRLSDVMKNVNGVNLGSSRGSTQETFYARGYSLSSTNIFKNGSRVSSGVISEASTLESVEVLKGSAALLYGNVTSGAVLNMVTKQPKYDFGGEVSMRSGSYNLYKPTVDIYGPISKKLAFRVVSTTEDAESYRKSVTSKRFYVNPSLLYTFSKKTSLLVQGDYLNYENTPDFGIGSMKVMEGSAVLNYVIPTTISRSSFFNTSWAYNKAKQGTASATVNHQLTQNWKLSSMISYQKYDRNAFAAERIQAESNGDYYRNLVKNKSYDQYKSGQFNLNGSFRAAKIAHNIVIGGDAEQYITSSNTYTTTKSSKTYYLDEQNQERQLFAYDTINILDPALSRARTNMIAMNPYYSTETPVYRFGTYIQDLIELTPKLKVLAGVRWSYQKTAVAKQYSYLTSQTVNSANSRFDRAFSPKVGVVYQPIKTTSLFASYSNNFVPNSGTTADNTNLEPSVIDQYEAGVKNDFLGGKLSANISAYHIKNNKNYVTSATNSSFRELGGETASDGAELDINGAILPGLNLIAGYSYNFIRYTKTSGAKNSYITGERLVGSVANTANASLFYTLKSGRLRNLKLGATANYIGKRNGGWNNQYDPGKVWTNNPAQNDKLYEYDRLIPLSAYTTADISAGYSFRNFSLLAKLSNITNELNYVVHENYSVNPIAPRQFITTLAYKF